MGIPAGLIPDGVQNPVAVLAHPDDESLWCAGLIVESGLKWTVICCSIPVRDPERAYKFFDACEVIGAAGRLLPFPERDELRLDPLRLGQYDFILTHGEAGEYGHMHHNQLHDFVKQHFAERARYIGYGGQGRMRLHMSEATKARKLSALKCYNARKDRETAPQWQLLLNNYGSRFNLWIERYD